MKAIEVLIEDITTILNISMKASRSEAFTEMDAITFIILAAVSAIEQTHVLLTTAEAAYINVVLVQQLQVEVAKGSLFLTDSMGLMPVAATGHDHRQVVASMVGGVAKVATHHHRRVIKQGPTFFLDLIQDSMEMIQ